MINRQMVNYLWKRKRYLKYTKHTNKRIVVRLARVMSLLLLLIAVHTIAMVALEKMSWGDGVWVSLTTITTVGYGDFSPATGAGRLATVLCMYTFGISLLAQVAAEFFEYRLSVRDAKQFGYWKWKDMSNHIVIINAPDQNAESYLNRLVQQIRLTTELKDLPVQILTPRFESGLPVSISRQGVVHYTGHAEDSDNLNAVNVKQAKHIIVLSRSAHDSVSDSLTFDVLSRIGEIGCEADVTAEVVSDSNRKRFKAAGASALIRPIRAYPEFIVRTLVAPGVEEVLENLFTHDDDHMIRFDVAFGERRWSDIVCQFVTAGAGIPMAYVDSAGIHSNPLPDAVCTGSGIITLVNEQQTVTLELVEQCLSA